MFTNADCTIYNAYHDTAKRCEAWKRTVIKSVYWEDVSGENSQQTGLLNDCSAFVVIPKTSVDLQNYQKPKDFKSNPTGFTFAPNDVIVRGICNEDYTSIKSILALDDSHTILKASDFVYGSTSVQHWEVQSK
jgi:hypothetical protein